MLTTIAYWSVDNWHVVIKDVTHLVLALTGFFTGILALLKATANTSKIEGLFKDHSRNADDIRQLNSDQTHLAARPATAVVPIAVAPVEKPATEKTQEEVKNAIDKLPHEHKKGKNA